MAKLEFKTAYGERKREGFQTSGESMTQQNFAQEADSKTSMKKDDRTGIITSVTRGVAQYGDYSEVNEYRVALDMINQANSSFGAFPSQLRAMFQNAAGECMEFATNPANDEKMDELGLAAAAPSPTVEAQPVEKKRSKAE